VLFKTLNVDMKDVKPSQLLGGRERDFENNPDFSNKDLSFQQPLAPPGPVRVPAAAPLQALELPPEQPASISSLPHTPKAPQVTMVALVLYGSRIWPGQALLLFPLELGFRYFYFLLL
jgi:hypothetical protein